MIASKSFNAENENKKKMICVYLYVVLIIDEILNLTSQLEPFFTSQLREVVQLS